MSILEMSVSGAVMILAVVVIRALTINRLPKNTFSALWAVTLVRLLIPYSLPSVFSVYSLLGGPISPAKTEPFETGVSAVQTPVFPETDVGIMSPAPAAPAGSPAVPPYMLIWLIGVLACAAFFTIAYWKCLREFREALPVDSDFAADWLRSHSLRRRIRLLQSDRISAPLTYGVFRPVILLPKSIDRNDETTLAYVLAHEYVHIRRLDAVTKLVLTAAFCVHWFNPTVWVMYVLANRDMELSCDEAVIRLFGERTKSAYALTLIRMEETRSGLSPLYNNFSKHSIQERIIAIMKTKRTTRITVLAGAALVVCMTTAFATSAQAQDDGQTHLDTVYADSTLMSYTDPTDGKTYYSRDNGKTWTAMTDEELNSASDRSGVEWWTAEEYAVWLEREKAELRSIIGSQGWTPSTGWFTWTQEMADEAIAQYEQTLKDIQAGQMISKPTADGDTMIMFGYDPSLQATETDTTTALGSVAMMDSITDNTVMPGSGQTLTPVLLEAYKAYGLTYDEAQNAFYFNGKLVRYFYDGYTLENGAATIYEHVSKDGVVDVHTVRQATQNADGSIDPGGKLAGIEEYSQAEFDSRFMMTPETAQEAVAFGFVGSTGGTTFEERFARYKDFGITYVEAEGVSGRGNVYLNGRLVSYFTDVVPNGDAFSFTSADQSGIPVQTDYDEKGNLIGVQELLPDTIAADKAALQYARDERRADWEQTGEILAPYLAFGLEYHYDPDDVYGSLTMTWQGKPVHSLFDAKRELFIANSLGDGGLGGDAVDLEAVYDSSGHLTGLKIAGE